MGYVHMVSLDLEHEDILPQVTEKTMSRSHPPAWSEIQTKVHEQSPWVFQKPQLEAEEKKRTDFEKENDLNQTFMTLKDGGWPFSNPLEHSSVFLRQAESKIAGDNLANLRWKLVAILDTILTYGGCHIAKIWM